MHFFAGYRSVAHFCLNSFSFIASDNFEFSARRGKCMMRITFESLQLTLALENISL